MRQFSAISAVTGLFLALFLFGCSTSTYVMNGVDPGAPETVTLLVENDDYLFVPVIDGNKMLTSKVKFSLAPGEHTLAVHYLEPKLFKPHTASLYVLRFQGEAGHTYLLKQKAVGRFAKIWIEDAVSGVRVGRVDKSSNEPAEPSEVYEQSPYFTLTAPADPGWQVLYRNVEGVMLRKAGERVDETYAAYVKLVALPKFASAKSFAAYVEREQNKDLDPKRFKNPKRQSVLHDGRGDYCISYQASAEDWKARKRTRRNPMILEMAGFFCRHPKYPEVGIAFDYSHRCFDDQLDPQLQEKAKTAFEQLKF